MILLWWLFRSSSVNSSLFLTVNSEISRDHRVQEGQRSRALGQSTRRKLHTKGVRSGVPKKPELGEVAPGAVGKLGASPWELGRGQLLLIPTCPPSLGVGRGRKGRGGYRRRAYF